MRADFSAVVALCVMTACHGSGGLVPVVGRVVFQDGEAVSFGVIEFVPRAGGAAARAGIEADGRFTLKTAGRVGAVCGDHDVYVVQPTVLEGVEPHDHQRHGHGKQPRRIHLMYGLRGKSGLTARIGPDTSDPVVITVYDSTATP